QTVDDWARRLAPLDWGRRGEMLAEAAAAFGEDLSPDKSDLAGKGFLTAALERWGAPDISDPRQAILYLASLDVSHRAQAERYLEAHPELRALLEQES